MLSEHVMRLHAGRAAVKPAAPERPGHSGDDPAAGTDRKGLETVSVTLFSLCALAAVSVLLLLLLLPQRLRRAVAECRDPVPPVLIKKYVAYARYACALSSNAW